VDNTGKVRNTMIHHFPNSASMHSTIRIGDYKLIHNFDPFKTLELYRLYEDGEKRVDIEEMKDLSQQMPDKTREMNRVLLDSLKSMQASFPFNNPYCNKNIPHKNGVCKVSKQGKSGNSVWVEFTEHGNKVKSAWLLYSLNGGHQYEEWFRNDAIVEGNMVKATLPEGTTHYLFNLVDEHQFMVSYPRMGSMSDYQGGKYSVKALAVDATIER
jgi:hypothetical protein